MQSDLEHKLIAVGSCLHPLFVNTRIVHEQVQLVELSLDLLCHAFHIGEAREIGLTGVQLCTWRLGLDPRFGCSDALRVAAMDDNLPPLQSEPLGRVLAYTVGAAGHERCPHRRPRTLHAKPDSCRGEHCGRAEAEGWLE